MKQLWDKKGYEYLGIKTRIYGIKRLGLRNWITGKSQEKGATGSDRDLDNLNLSEHQGTVIEMTFQQESESGNQRNATQNANSELTSLMEPRYANPQLQRTKICV